MARENQAMECLTLVRSCFENMLLVAGLCERGAEFVKDMRSDNAANLKALGNLARPDVVGDTTYIKFVDGQVQRFLAEYAEKKPEKLSLGKPKQFFSAYRKYRALSHDPAHASLSALARHFSPRRKLNVVPPFKPGERLVALALGCEALLTVCRGVDLLMGNCAIEIQRAMVERNAEVAPDKRIEFRIGIHLGDVVEESDGDLMGDGVNIAARLQGVAKPGGICLSEDAYRQVSGRLEMAVTDLGPTQLKNIERSIRVYSLDVGQPAQAKPINPGVPKRPSAVLVAGIAAFIVIVSGAGYFLSANRTATVVPTVATPAVIPHRRKQR